MSEGQCTEWLGGWEGYVVSGVERRELRGWGKEIQIHLRAVSAGLRSCSGCGQPVARVHDVTLRWIRDLPLLDAQTWLRVPRYRLRCPRCGPRLESLSWLGRYQRVTQRLAESVGRLCAVLPVQHVAEFFGLGWDAVKAIDRAYLEATIGPIDLSDVKTILIDEFAIQKGHRYATVVAEAASRRVLWVGRGRSRQDLRPFFELLGPTGCRHLLAVGMDMNASYEQEVRLHCPQAEIVYDLFHVVAKYGREVIDRVRVDEANRLRHDKPARKVIKSARWLLLRNPEHLGDDRVRLQELLAANRRLLTVYLLKEDLKLLWRNREPEQARHAWKHWHQRAIRSRIEPLKRFAQRLKPYVDGILAHARWPLNTSVLEGINNKIKVIKRMAYGFRDDDYFFLKIRAAFPGIAG